MVMTTMSNTAVLASTDCEADRPASASRDWEPVREKGFAGTFEQSPSNASNSQAGTEMAVGATGGS